MNTSIELTFYPFNESFVAPIKKTIVHLNTYQGVRVKTFPTATVLMGEHERVMEVLTKTLTWCHNEFGSCVFIAKFLPGYEVLD